MFLPAALLMLLMADISAGIETDPKSLAASRRRPSSLVTSDIPIVEYTAHNRGEILLAIANNGTFGTLGSPIPDPFTGEAIPSCVYPKGSDIVYLCRCRHRHHRPDNHQHSLGHQRRSGRPESSQ